MNFDPGLLTIGVLFTVCGASLLTISRQPKFELKPEVYLATRQGDRNALVVVKKWDDDERSFRTRNWECVIDKDGKPDLELTYERVELYDENNKPR